MNPVPSAPTETHVIDARYLLLQGSTPVFVDANGERFLDELWAIDARAHTTYLPDLRIASPFIPARSASLPLASIDHDPRLSQIKFIGVPQATSRPRALLQLPRTVIDIWRAVGRADIVHVGIAGWPYPLGWLGAPMARLRGRLLIVIVESAPWRHAPDGRPSAFQRAQEWVYERFGRAIVRRADLALFTTDQYRQSLGGARGANEHVTEASWISDDQIITDAERRAVEAARESSGDPGLRVAFFGRLTADKGIHLLMQAMAGLAADAAVSLDVYGDGPELAALQRELASNPKLARVRLCGTLAYGAALFNRMRDVDCIIVPSFGDEQPRIVYDAFSQGVPLLASATAGLRQCVAEGETGLFFGIGDVEGLRGLLQRLADPLQRQALRHMSARCIEVARAMTHAQMHRRRAALIAGLLRDRAPVGVAPQG